jgi:hypothetical protein
MPDYILKCNKLVNQYNKVVEINPKNLQGKIESGGDSVTEK